jgi:PAS domain S-box-containing protein
MFADLHHLSHHAAWRRQLELLLESAGEGIYGIDLSGRCIFINRAGAELLGYSPDEVLGRNMHYLIHHSHADRALMPVHECRIFKAFQQGQGCRVEDEVLWRRDGTSFPAEYASYPIDDGDKVVGAVVTFTDITERKATEAALHAAQVELERRVAERTAELEAANRELKLTHENLRRLSAHLNSVRESERAGIARDIHDDLGASLTAILLELNWLGSRLADDEVVRPHVDAALDIGRDAIDAVRRILNDLRPGVLDHLGLWAALECLLDETQARTDLVCALDCPQEVERCRLGRDAEIAIYRIVQEIVTNVKRHAGASRITMVVRADARDLVICVEDDGVGMRATAEPTSFGLLGIRERAHAIGGVVVIDSAPGRGTEVCLRLPGVLTRGARG